MCQNTVLDINLLFTENSPILGNPNLDKKGIYV